MIMSRPCNMVCGSLQASVSRRFVVHWCWHLIEGLLLLRLRGLCQARLQRVLRYCFIVRLIVGLLRRDDRIYHD